MINGWKKPNGAWHNWEKNGKWVGYTYDQGKKIFIISSIKDGMLEIIGRTKTKAQAMSFLKDYFKSH